MLDRFRTYNRPYVLLLKSREKKTEKNRRKRDYGTLLGKSLKEKDGLVECILKNDEMDGSYREVVDFSPITLNVLR